MYLKLTYDEADKYTASFCNNESMNDESKECFKKPIPVKFNPCHYPDDLYSFCFEADINDNLRKSFERFGVKMDEKKTKLQFYLKRNGNIGPCS